LLQLALGLLDQLERLGAVSAEVVFGLLELVLRLFERFRGGVDLAERRRPLLLVL